MKTPNFNFKKLLIIRYQILFVFAALILVPMSCSDDDMTGLQDSNLDTDNRQWVFSDFTNQISTCEAQNLTYFIEDCFIGTEYDGIIEASMQAYNNAPLNLNWSEVNTAEAADLVFDCAQGGLCGQAAASFPVDLEALHPNLIAAGSIVPNVQTIFPSGGSIGGLILVNVNPTTCPCTDDELNICFFRNTIMHEVAHALGLTHNDIEAILTTNGLATHVDGTPTGADPSSIINSGNVGDWCVQTCTFSPSDIIALQSLYPPITTSIEGPDVLCLGQTGEFCLVGEATRNFNLVVSWSTEPKFITPTTNQISKKRFCTEFSSLTPGQHTITVWIVEEGCTYSVTQTVFVHEKEDCDNCYCMCECRLENQWGDQSYYEKEISCNEDCSGIEGQGNVGNFVVEYCEKVLYCN